VMQNQAIQAALAAANTQQTNQALLIQQAQAASVHMVSAGGPTGIPAGQPGGSMSPEFQKAMQIMAECASSGRVAQDSEVEWLIGIREKLRYKKDFQSADDMRNSLRNSIGVELYEKEKRWSTSDGRQGNIPMWNDLQ